MCDCIPSAPPSRRPILGVLVSIVDYHQPWWLGAADAAQARGVNLICFMGGALPSSGQPHVAYVSPHTLPSTAFFDLADPTYLDGLVIWAGSGVGLGMHLNDAEMSQFIARYRALPIVNYEGLVSGVPCVATDTYQGMCELIAHLIEIHGYRRIALIRGPERHMESEERYRAYLDTLQRYGIPIRPELISPPCGWGSRFGIEMIDLLIDQRGIRPGIDLDAVATTEINHALGAVQALRARGVQVPEEVAVVGFNDRLEAQTIHPPMTVVRKPFYESGVRVVEAVLDLIAGNPVADRIPAPARLVIRRSCGCWALQAKDKRPDPFAYRARDELAAHLLRMAASGQGDPRSARLLQGLADLLGTVVPVEREDAQEQCWTMLEEALRERRSAEALIQWHSTLSELSYYLESALGAIPDHRFWRQIQVVFEQEIRRLEGALSNSVVEYSRILLEMSQEMMNAGDIAHLLDVLARRLPELGIADCYLSLYDNPADLTSNTEWAHLALAIQAGRRLQLEPQGRRFRSRRLVPEGLLTEERAFAFAATPLHFGGNNFGFALFRIGPRHGPVYLSLAQEIGSALQSVFLLREYRQSEHARRESEARLRTLLEHMPVEFWAKDIDGKYMMQNSAMRLLLGDNVGLTLDDVTIDENLRTKWKSEDERVFDGETIHSEHVLNTGGQERIYRQVVAPVLVDGAITAILGLMFDVTEQKQLEDSLRRAKEAADAANRAKSAFLANMSHELRTPLNGILGYAQILQRDPDISPQQQRGLSVIRKSGEHLLMLINDILDLAKVEAGKARLQPHPYRLPELLEDVCDMIEHRALAKDLAWYRQIGPLPQTVFGDDQRLRQVLVNLLDNAVKFTDHGSITLFVNRLSGDSDYIRFQVTDTGIGIAAQDLETIFAPFEQLNNHPYQEKGTGLGLSISRELVALMGGTIQVASEPGRGSSFWFDIALPAAEDALYTQGSPPRPIIGIVDRKPRILVVDDNADNRAVVLELLKPLEFAVAEAPDGAAALALMAEFRPDAVILDLVMSGMNGFELIANIRGSAEFRTTRLIVSSASSYEDDRVRSLRSGADAFVPKPLELPILLETLRQQLQLEWRYGEDAVLPEAELSTALPDATLAELIELARIGDVVGVQQRIDALDQPEFAWFTARVRRFTDNFQMKQLCVFLETYREVRS